MVEHDSAEHRAETLAAFETSVAWRSGAVAGFLATVVMGAVISLVDLETVRLVIAGLYGQEGSLLAGWIAHLTHGTLFGVVFAVVLSDPGLHRVTEWRWKTLLAGLVYATILAVVGAGIVLPIWLSVVGFATPPSIPHVTTPLLTWHVVYGVVLGGLFPVLEHL